MMIEEVFIFIDLVDAGSFSKLSEKIGVSQPTLSRKIQALEDNYGSLLIRTPQGIRTTDRGRNLYENFLAHKISIDKSFKNYNRQLNQTTHISLQLPLWISLHVINPLLPKFLSDNPDICLKIRYVDRAVDFIKDSIDIAVVSVEPKQSFQISKYLGYCKVLFYCRPDYVLIHDLPQNLNSLSENHKLIAVNSDSSTGLQDNYINQTLYSETSNTLEDSVALGSQIIVDTHAIASQFMLSSNEYIGLDYAYALKDKFANNLLIRVLPNYYAEARKYFITVPERNLASNKQKVFDFLVKVITSCMETGH